MTKSRITLTDATTGHSWDYETERQVRTVAVLYARQHPRNSLRVTIGDRVVWKR